MVVEVEVALVVEVEVIVMPMLMVMVVSRFGEKTWGNSRLVPFNHGIRVDHEVTS